MKTILLIGDSSPAAAHASAFVALIAKNMQANILLANTCKVQTGILSLVSVGEKKWRRPQSSGYKSKFLFEGDDTATFIPQVEEVDISDLDDIALAEFIIKAKIYLVVKGISNVPGANDYVQEIDFNTVLNRVGCPLLLIPETWPIKKFERLVYISDLRYCRLQVVRYLADLAKACQAGLAIAHLAASGLPNMEENYSRSIFEDEICANVGYGCLFFNNIHEKNMLTAIDVIVHGLNNDLLVLVNRSSHFEEIVGNNLGNILPPHISVPLLIFPY